MSLSAELRVLCHQLSTTPTTTLPHITSILLHNLLRCQTALSSEASPTTESGSPETSVLVHKLKTQITSLLQGKSVEGRYAAAALIKTIVDIGGWEVLRGINSWTRGLLLNLGKPDPVITKKLCILSLTGIYSQVHQYQTLVREIATPTLPNFVLSCLNQLTSTSSRKEQTTATPLREFIFESFSLLVQQYPTIFRPYNKQIRAETRAYLAPTICDRQLVTTSLIGSARHLAVLMYQTAAKNGSGEEWVRGVHNLINKVHGTVDQVYRAVIEDWEPSGKYVSQHIDMNRDVHGGSEFEEDLPVWNGIEAGIERLLGLLGLLGDHFRYQTIAVITVPLGSITALWTRLMSVVPPSDLKQNSRHSGMRLHPAVERIEREILWAGLPSIHVASMKMYLALAQRLHYNFASLAQSCLAQVAWTFSHNSHDENFRAATYQLVVVVLPLCGSSLQKSSVDFMLPIIKACCKDIRNVVKDGKTSKEENRKKIMSRSSTNVDTFLTNKLDEPIIAQRRHADIVEAANRLLPSLLTYIPQQYLQGYVRAEIDRTSILSRHKDAMVASILYPFVDKNGKSLPSIIPHLCREVSNSGAVEALLRPRQPVIQFPQSISRDQFSANGLEADEDMMEDVVATDNLSIGQPDSTLVDHTNEEIVVVPKSHDIISNIREPSPTSHRNMSMIHENLSSSHETMSRGQEVAQPIQMVVADDEGSDESVHLTMELSDSEDEILS